MWEALLLPRATGTRGFNTSIRPKRRATVTAVTVARLFTFYVVFRGTGTSPVICLAREHGRDARATQVLNAPPRGGSSHRSAARSEDPQDRDEDVDEVDVEHQRPDDRVARRRLAVALRLDRDVTEHL